MYNIVHNQREEHSTRCDSKLKPTTDNTSNQKKSTSQMLQEDIKNMNRLCEHTGERETFQVTIRYVMCEICAVLWVWVLCSTAVEKHISNFYIIPSMNRNLMNTSLFFSTHIFDWCSLAESLFLMLRLCCIQFSDFCLLCVGGGGGTISSCIPSVILYAFAFKIVGKCLPVVCVGSHIFRFTYTRTPTNLLSILHRTSNTSDKHLFLHQNEQ